MVRLLHFADLHLDSSFASAGMASSEARRRREELRAALAIEAGVAEMRELGLQVEVGPMSSQVTGDTALVFEGLRKAFEAVAQEGHVVMTMTVSNACPLPHPDRH